MPLLLLLRAAALVLAFAGRPTRAPPRALRPLPAPTRQACLPGALASGPQVSTCARRACAAAHHAVVVLQRTSHDVAIIIHAASALGRSCAVASERAKPQSAERATPPHPCFSSQAEAVLPLCRQPLLHITRTSTSTVQLLCTLHLWPQGDEDGRVHGGRGGRRYLTDTGQLDSTPQVITNAAAASYGSDSAHAVLDVVGVRGCM